MIFLAGAQRLRVTLEDARPGCCRRAVPCPLTQAILFFLKRNSTPLVRPVTILSLQRACT